MLKNTRKHKLLSKLIALTFAFNTISPVAFASETTATTTTATNTSTPVNIKTAQANILNRISQTAVSAFKSQKLNITDEELNNLMNIPLSSVEEKEYYTQEEKDYNNLQLLIAQGLNTKEKRDKALLELQAVEDLTKQDPSVGGLSKTDQYIKSLLENYDEIESRASSVVNSAITPSENSIIAYRNLLKIAKAERQACRNDAVKNKTNPDDCKLSERGLQAAQMLTYLTNQQVNQTTDSKKTTTATNSTTNVTTGERTCADTTKKPAANNIYKCCPTDKPYINTSTGKCDTKTQNSSNDDDDDDDNSKSIFYGGLLAGGAGTVSECLSNPDKCKSDGEPLGTGTTNTKKDRKDTDTTTKKQGGTLKKINGGISKSKSAKGNYTPTFAKRVGKVTLEFNEKSGVENVNGVPAYLHIAESDTEFQVKVHLSGTGNSETTTKDGKEQKPLKVNIVSYNFFEDGSTYENHQSGNPEEFLTVVYSENKGVGEAKFKKFARDKVYPLYIEITDGTSRIYYTVYYKIYTMQANITDEIKNKSASEIEILPNDEKDNSAMTNGTLQGKLTGAQWQNDKCVLNVQGKYRDNKTNDVYDTDTNVNYEQINESDCNKLNDKAKNKNLEITLENTSVSLDESGENLAFDASNTVNPALKDMDSGEYISEEVFHQEFESTANLPPNHVSIPFGKTVDGYQVNYDAETGTFKKFTDDGWVEMTEDDISKGFLDGKEIPEGAKIEFALNKSNGLPAISVNGEVVDVNQSQINQDTSRNKNIIAKTNKLSSITSEVANAIHKQLDKITSPLKTIKGEVKSIGNKVQNAIHNKNDKKRVKAKQISTTETIEVATGNITK